ncbi:hypothetical protein I5M19_06050 [Mucilaginibacter sp. SD-g]|uniref:Uncharacterized protein n=1 Tax=Mucilaginibacter segetis TaxID=2793071 RepID=A0A934PQF6_9SPHI|nr:hypothetical protein [Mucilaginibacter segetis]
MTISLRIIKVFELTTRDMIIITGEILSGRFEIGRSLINIESKRSINFDSIEAIYSNEVIEQIALTFRNKSESEKSYLMDLKIGEIIMFQ